MRRIFEAMTENLSWFVEQREQLILVLEATEHEIPYVIKALEGVEQSHPSDVFLCVAHTVTDAEAYVDALMQNVETQVAAIQAIRREEQAEPWPEVPSSCHNQSLPPSQRIHALLRYLRAQILGPVDHHRIVLGLLPVVLGSAKEYARVVQGLLPRRGLEPWMAGVRIVIRDDREHPFLIPHLERERVDRVAIYGNLDFSPSAMEQALRQAVTDPELPEDEKARILVQLVALDHAHGRDRNILTNWGLLFNYYDRQNDDSMKALCLWGAAEFLHRRGHLPDAKAKYQQGLALAQDLATLPVALQLLMGVGEVSLKLEQWEESSEWFALADQVASKLLQVMAKCDIMERHGVALLAIGRTAEARDRWRATANLSRDVEYYTRCESALEHLVELFRRAGMAHEQKLHQRELAELRSQHMQQAPGHPS